MRKKSLWALALTFTLFGAAACAEAGPADDVGEQEQAPDSQLPDMPEPDLEGIPEVVAEVNGEPIDRETFETSYRGQFEQASMQALMSGEEIDQGELRQAIVENLIGMTLLTQEAAARGISASEEQVDATLEDLAQSNGMETGEEFIAALVDQGMDEDDVRAQLQAQADLELLIAEEAGDIEPSEDDLRDLYDQSVAQMDQEEDAEIPPYADVEDQLAQQVRAQKEGEAIQALVADLRERGDVVVHL